MDGSGKSGSPPYYSLYKVVYKWGSEAAVKASKRINHD